MEKFRCDICDKNFDSQTALDMHNKAKHSDKISSPKSFIDSKLKKKIRNWTIGILIVIIIFGLSTYLLLNIKNLPPTDIQGHIEENPPSHVMKEPMNILIQKHMLEHADGSGPQGIVINYNCIDFSCEEGSIEKLEEFAKKYPVNVYIAPYPKMDAKIALTRLGKIKVLDSYNEKEIDDFINNK